ncbi:unnamed protein product [Pseudo-nitzschia multistriata]|uniref:Uncharacterized protein n=1 Tax=Pseudo-nitzschia multistriata TaxID=183589 RepID=A0A448Z8Z8_9STRA|nr:unnamed protein product [Pseudo-nitzschia multistriata]
MSSSSSVSKSSSLGDAGTSESPTTSESTRKRKSDDIGDNVVDESPSCPDFKTVIPNEKPTVANCEEAFFDKKHPRTRGSSPALENPFTNKERTIQQSKAFFHDEERGRHEVNNACSPPSTPLSFRQEFHKVSTPTPSHYCVGVGGHSPTPSHYCVGGGSPLSVVDELFTGFYGCMPHWECAVPWRGDSDEDDDDDKQDQEEYSYDKNYILRRETSHDAEAIREHLSFPKRLGREYVSQSTEESRQQRNSTTINRTIRRTPSSRLTTLESDSREKLPGSKMFRRTEINKVTEIHWDEKVLDTATIEQMAKLSVY